MPIRTIRPANQEDKHHWDRIIHHPLQSWAWGEFRASMGVQVQRVVSTEGGEIVDGWQVTLHRIPMTNYTVGYFAKGPLPTMEMISALTLYTKPNHTISIQIEPNLVYSKTVYDQLPHSNRFIPSHRALFTPYNFVIDLRQSEEDLMKKLHPKTRYNIKIAQKHNVSIQEDNSPAAFDQYISLSQETTARQGFYAHNSQYHRTMWRIMRQANIATMFTATYQHKTVAAWILFKWKNSLYYPYGASSREHRQVMAPTLLLWEIIRWAKQHNFSSFDLWGALGPNPDQNDPWYGFHRFKEGFHPELIHSIGSFDYIINPVLYSGYTLADAIRWKYLRLKQKLF